MTDTPETPPETRPVPAALKQRNQILAVVAIVVAASVPILLAFGFDVCAPLAAVGIELDACKAAPAPAAAPAGDAGAK